MPPSHRRLNHPVELYPYWKLFWWFWTSDKSQVQSGSPNALLYVQDGPRITRPMSPEVLLQQKATRLLESWTEPSPEPVPSQTYSNMTSTAPVKSLWRQNQRIWPVSEDTSAPVSFSDQYRVSFYHILQSQLKPDQTWCCRSERETNTRPNIDPTRATVRESDSQELSYRVSSALFFRCFLPRLRCFFAGPLGFPVPAPTAAGTQATHRLPTGSFAGRAEQSGHNNNPNPNPKCAFIEYLFNHL